LPQGRELIMATKLDQEVIRGDTYNFSVTFIDKATGQPQALTGYTFVMRAVADGTEIYRQEVTPPGTRLTFPWTKDQTAALPTGQLTDYAIQARLGTERTTWLYGKINGAGVLSVD